MVGERPDAEFAERLGEFAGEVDAQRPQFVFEHGNAVAARDDRRPAGHERAVDGDAFAALAEAAPVVEAQRSGLRADLPDARASFEHEHVRSALCQFLRHGRPAGARADDDDVRPCVHSAYPLLTVREDKDKREKGKMEKKGLVALRPDTEPSFPLSRFSPLGLSAWLNSVQPVVFWPISDNACVLPVPGIVPLDLRRQPLWSAVA